MNLKNHDGLWVDEDSGTCVGYLMDFKDKGVFSPDGKVEITPEQAQKHNKLLSQGEILGLDNCSVGQWGTFYYLRGSKGLKVQTFIGAVVSEDVTINGQSITFRRGGKVFRGRLQKDADVFNFKRIS